MFNYSDEHLAQRCNVRIETVRSWQRGEEQPSQANLRQIRELMYLNNALSNARSGKYRQA
jgi:DNA-binding transcriptional regulator YiaG